MGIKIFLAGIVNAIVVIFIWMNSLGRDREFVTHPGVMTFAWLYSFTEPGARRDIRSSRVTSYISEITEFHPFILVLSLIPPLDSCISSCKTSRLAQRRQGLGNPWLPWQFVAMANHCYYQKCFPYFLFVIIRLCIQLIMVFSPMRKNSLLTRILPFPW